MTRPAAVRHDVPFAARHAVARSHRGASAAHAAYPDKPIRMVIGWSAGGGTDVVARVVAKHLSKQLGVAVVVENRDGASGMIATEMVAKRRPTAT